MAALLVALADDRLQSQDDKMPTGANRLSCATVYVPFFVVPLLSFHLPSFSQHRLTAKAKNKSEIPRLCDSRWCTHGSFSIQRTVLHATEVLCTTAVSLRLPYHGLWRDKYALD